MAAGSLWVSAGLGRERAQRGLGWLVLSCWGAGCQAGELWGHTAEQRELQLEMQGWQPGEHYLCTACTGRSSELAAGTREGLGLSLLLWGQP